MANTNPTDFRTLYFSRAELVKAIETFPEAHILVLGIENGKLGASDVSVLWAKDCAIDSDKIAIISQDVLRKKMEGDKSYFVTYRYTLHSGESITIEKLPLNFEQMSAICFADVDVYNHVVLNVEDIE